MMVQSQYSQLLSLWFISFIFLINNPIVYIGKNIFINMKQESEWLDKNSRIVLVGDLHIGTKGFREDIFNDILEDISKPNTLWVGLGDYVEGREPSHKFYDFEESTLAVGEQYDYFFKKIEPYVDRCLGMVHGNHEVSLINKTTLNPLQNFCFGANVNYFGDTGYLTLMCSDESYVDTKMRMVITHGAGGGATVGASLNKINNFAKNFIGDVVCVGHYHKLCSNIEVQPKVINGVHTWKPKLIVMNGSCLEGYRENGLGSYVEKKMLPPQALGYAVIEFDNMFKPSAKLIPY